MLDQIFPPVNGPLLVVIQQTTFPSVVDIDMSAKPKRVSNAVIRPFSYRIPITFVDTLTFWELNQQSRRAESIAYTVPMTDVRFHRRAAWPFIERFPGAWGWVRFGRVGFSRDTTSALVVARYTAIEPLGHTGRETFKLRRIGANWTVVDRIPDGNGIIKPEPVPYNMLHEPIDSTTLPHPRRKRIRGTVRDSTTGKPVASLAIRIDHVPLDERGRSPEAGDMKHWADARTDSAGRFLISSPPSGYVLVTAVCPRGRNASAGMLAAAALYPEFGLDTLLDFRVRVASCAQIARAIAAAEEQHRQNVARAKEEASARAVAATFSGTLRDVRSGRPVQRAPLRIGRRNVGGSDSLGRFSFSGVAPGKKEISVYCPVRRQWFGKVATTVAVHARPAAKHTLDIQIDMQRCADVPVDTAKVRTKGVWSIGFEDGFFTPCEKFSQIELGGYTDWSGYAYVVFAERDIRPPGGWPEIKEKDGYKKIFIVAEGELIGPGSYGHLGIATYLLRVSRITSAEAPSKRSCSAPRP
ncbi:MAG: carboxypeptidase-like regulatory domain-containing protein [Gemmatimonadaceae bacterium]